MKKTVAFTFILFLSGLFFACSKTDNNTSGGSGGGGATFSCVGISPKFAADVQPILTGSCAVSIACHATGSTNSGGPFTNHTEVFAKRSNIRAAILSGSMPQGSTLTQAQKNTFICWIDSGAPNN